MILNNYRSKQLLRYMLSIAYVLVDNVLRFIDEFLIRKAISRLVAL